MKNKKHKKTNISHKVVDVSFKTMGIKSRFFNIVRKALWEYSDIPYNILYKGKKELTKEAKIQLFDEFYTAFGKSNSEFRAYKTKRKFKAEVERKRALKLAAKNAEILAEEIKKETGQVA